MARKIIFFLNKFCDNISDDNFISCYLYHFRVETTETHTVEVEDDFDLDQSHFPLSVWSVRFARATYFFPLAVKNNLARSYLARNQCFIKGRRRSRRCKPSVIGEGFAMAAISRRCFMSYGNKIAWKRSARSFDLAPRISIARSGSADIRADFNGFSPKNRDGEARLESSVSLFTCGNSVCQICRIDFRTMRRQRDASNRISSSETY